MQTFITGQKNVTTSGTPVQLGKNPVPDGIALVIKAKVGNAGNITIGYSSVSALNTGSDFFSLTAGQSLAVDVDNLNDIWLDCTVSGDGVEYVFERQFSS
jgi:hypothetical protein